MRDDIANLAFTTIPRWSAPGGAAPRAATGTAAGPGAHGVRLHAELTEELERTARRLRTDLPALLRAAHARVLASLAAERQLLIGQLSPGAPDRPELLELYVADSPWNELVAHAAAARGFARPAGAHPEALLDLSGVEWGEDVPQGRPAPAPRLDGALLCVSWTRDEAGLALRVLYDRGAFDGAYAGRVVGYHLSALRLLAADPTAEHHRQSLLSDAELKQQLDQLAGPSVELPDRSFIELFEERARSTPDAPAVVHRATRWTYRELDERSHRISRALVAAGVRTEDVVAVVMDRNPDWIAAALGVFKAGGVYLPVRPDFPVARVATQLGRSDCHFVLTEPDSEELVRAASAALTTAPSTLSVPAIEAAGGPAEPLALPVTFDQAAYIYFTSGSTGTPKGALCEHGGLLNHLYAKIDDTGLAAGAGEVVTQIASQCFDISLWQFAAPLLVGGAVQIVDTATQLDVTAFVDELVAGGVTVAQVVPSYLDVLLTHLEAHPRPLGALRVVSVTGEALKLEFVQRWFAAYPDIKLVNAYGLTEVSDDTLHEVLDQVPERDFVSVGRPLRNVRTYVLDENLLPAPLGSPGELAFAGVCVGRGYVNDEERTRQAFVADPFRPDTRMYRTGDFGRWLPEGRIEFLGRRDEQVKIRGYRVEISEIENRLLGVAGVREAAVVIDGGARQQRNLVACYAGDAELTADGLRTALAAALPDYMVPAAFHRLERLPLTENGKVDKKALTKLAAAVIAEAGPSDAPRTPAERRLAALWADVLDLPQERIGRHDDFFALGGTSLAGVRLLIALDRALGLKDLADRPTLADFAAALEATGHPATTRPRGDRAADPLAEVEVAEPESA